MPALWLSERGRGKRNGDRLLDAAATKLSVPSIPPTLRGRSSSANESEKEIAVHLTQAVREAATWMKRSFSEKTGQRARLPAEALRHE
jgi:hypothetical protein